MVVRMWHGRVPTPKAPAYRAFLNARAIPDYRSVLLEFEPTVVHCEIVGQA